VIGIIPSRISASPYENILNPTNNTLVWDCVKTSLMLLERLQADIEGMSIEEYWSAAKKTYFKINVCKDADERAELFTEQLRRFGACITRCRIS
jgi:IS5 family transposase